MKYFRQDSVNGIDENYSVRAGGSKSMSSKKIFFFALTGAPIVIVC